MDNTNNPKVRIRPNLNNPNGPRFNTPLQMMGFLKYLNYVDFTTLMSPEQVIESDSGSCHDQALFMLDELSLMGYESVSKFLMAVDDDDQGGETHTFVYCIIGSKFYWFENAWEDYQGMHDFNTEEELLTYVIDAFTNRNPNQYIYMGDFIPEDHTIGESLGVFVDICMENAELV